LADTFSANSKPGFFSTFDTNQQAPRRLDVTDIAVNKTFHVEMPKNLSVTSVQGANVDSGVDFDKMRADVEDVRADYLQTDAQIKDVVTEAAHQVMGKEAGDNLMGQLLPKGGPTHGQAAATMMDPSGTAGALWSAFNSIQSERNATPPAEMLAQMDKILSHIQEASHQQSGGRMDMGGKEPLKVPKEFDFSSITAEELMDFMKREVDNDPVMQQTQEALDALDYFESNQEYAIEHDDEVVTVAKIETALQNNDGERLAELVGGKQEAEIVETAHNAFGVALVAENIKHMPRIELDRNHEQQLKTAEDLRIALEQRTATMAPAFDREAELRKTANYNSAPGMAA